MLFFFFFSSRRRHTRSLCDWSSDVCSSDLSDSSKDKPLPVKKDWAPPPVPQKLKPIAPVAKKKAAVPKNRTLMKKCIFQKLNRSEERRVGKECRTRRSQDH